MLTYTFQTVHDMQFFLCPKSGDENARMSFWKNNFFYFLDLFFQNIRFGISLPIFWYKCRRFSADSVKILDQFKMTSYSHVWIIYRILINFQWFWQAIQTQSKRLLFCAFTPSPKVYSRHLYAWNNAFIFTIRVQYECHIKTVHHHWNLAIQAGCMMKNILVPVVINSPLSDL